MSAVVLVRVYPLVSSINSIRASGESRMSEPLQARHDRLNVALIVHADIGRICAKCRYVNEFRLHYKKTSNLRTSKSGYRYGYQAHAPYNSIPPGEGPHPPAKSPSRLGHKPDGTSGSTRAAATPGGLDRYLGRSAAITRPALNRAGSYLVRPMGGFSQVTPCIFTDTTCAMLG